MSSHSTFGNCHICGNYMKLSFEHVPPRSAFNDRPLVLKRGKELLTTDLETITGKVLQRGAGDYTLCEKCNNTTGKWYGSAFVDWAYQAMRILHYTKGKPSLYYTFHIFPLRVIKQILCMFFSANGYAFQQAHQDLVRMVSNRDHNGLDPKYRIYAYFNASNRSRQTGITSAFNIKTKDIRVTSEIAFPPIGYLMTVESKPLEERLCDITFMAKYRYNDWKHISLRLPVLPIYTFYPGDYRDKDTVLRDAATSLSQAELVKEN